eukprot:68860_1
MKHFGLKVSSNTFRLQQYTKRYCSNGSRVHNLFAADFKCADHLQANRMISLSSDSRAEYKIFKETLKEQREMPKFEPITVPKHYDTKHRMPLNRLEAEIQYLENKRQTGNDTETVRSQNTWAFLSLTTIVFIYAINSKAK